MSKFTKIKLYKIKKNYHEGLTKEWYFGIMDRQ